MLKYWCNFGTTHFPFSQTCVYVAVDFNCGINTQRLNIESLIKNRIKEEVQHQICALLPTLAEEIVNRVSKPEYTSWGRYLNPKQAMKYLGCKSHNGLKSLLRRHNISGTKSNSKSVKYDRQELDKVNINMVIEDYKKTLL